MTIEWLRDLVIVILGILTILILILGTIIMGRLYFRVRKVLVSIETINEEIRKVVAFGGGIGRGIAKYTKIFSKGGTREYPE